MTDKHALIQPDKGQPATPIQLIEKSGLDAFVKSLSGPVSTPRSEAGVIITERGAADLRGCSLRERERRLSAISSST